MEAMLAPLALLSRATRGSRPLCTNNIVTCEEPGQKRRVPKIIGSIVGNLQYPAKHSGSRDPSNGQTRFLDDFVSAAFSRLGPRRVSRQ
jgi:hypothetical protein